MTRALASPFGCVEGSPPRRGSPPAPPREHQDSPQADRRQTEIAGVHLRGPSWRPAFRPRATPPLLTNPQNGPDRARTAIFPFRVGVSNVVALRAERQMIRIDTRGRIATVHNDRPHGHVAMSQYIGHPMRIFGVLLAAGITAKIDLSVAVAEHPRPPQPATSRSLVFRVETCYDTTRKIPPPQATPLAAILPNRQVSITSILRLRPCLARIDNRTHDVFHNSDC